MGGNGNKVCYNGTGMGIKSEASWDGIGNGNELVGMRGNGNVASHSRTSLIPSPLLVFHCNSG